MSFGYLNLTAQCIFILYYTEKYYLLKDILMIFAHHKLFREVIERHLCADVLSGELFLIVMVEKKIGIKKM